MTIVNQGDISHAKHYDALLGLMRTRNSCRKYMADKPVPRDQLEKCVEAARCAPSACNRQPWRFVIVDDPDLVSACRDQVKKPGIPHPWWADVPVFVALCAKLDLVTHRVAPVLSGIPYYLIDIGIAGEHFVLAAQSLGLGTCWIGWFKPKAVRKLLNIPRGVRVVSLITVGWPANGPSETRQQAETECLNRAPLKNIMAWNGWQD